MHNLTSLKRSHGSREYSPQSREAFKALDVDILSFLFHYILQVFPVLRTGLGTRICAVTNVTSSAGNEMHERRHSSIPMMTQRSTNVTITAGTAATKLPRNRTASTTTKTIISSIKYRTLIRPAIITRYIYIDMIYLKYYFSAKCTGSLMIKLLGNSVNEEGRDQSRQLRLPK